MTDLTQQALEHLIAGAIFHVRQDVASSKAAVHLLEKPARDSLLSLYGEARAWRGLADDSTLAMHDALRVLLGHDPLLDAPKPAETDPVDHPASPNP